MRIDNGKSTMDQIDHDRVVETLHNALMFVNIKEAEAKDKRNRRRKREREVISFPYVIDDSTIINPFEGESSLVVKLGDEMPKAERQLTYKVSVEKIKDTEEPNADAVFLVMKFVPKYKKIPDKIILKEQREYTIKEALKSFKLHDVQVWLQKCNPGEYRWFGVSLLISRVR